MRLEPVAAHLWDGRVIPWHLKATDDYKGEGRIVPVEANDWRWERIDNTFRETLRGDATTLQDACEAWDLSRVDAQVRWKAKEDARLTWVATLGVGTRVRVEFIAPNGNGTTNEGVIISPGGHRSDEWHIILPCWFVQQSNTSQGPSAFDWKTGKGLSAHPTGVFTLWPLR